MMKRKGETQNLVMIVLDTLREDAANGLEDLLKLGFTSVGPVYSPSSWTLPSHVSLFTGLLPSAHGIHESERYHIRNINALVQDGTTADKMGLLRIAREGGYTTYCLTSNPLISPRYGFSFDFHRIYDSRGDATNHSEITSGDSPRLSMAASLIVEKKFGPLARLVYDNQFRRNASRLLGKPPLEKGSRFIIHDLKGLELKEPFLLFINLMEAHPPYSWHERPSRLIQLDSILGRQFPQEQSWTVKYYLHAGLAVRRAIEIVKLLESYFNRSTFVVTSDHGQLLGESGRYDHGYFLDDCLVRVPLFLRFSDTPVSGGREMGPISLADVPRLVLDSHNHEETLSRPEAVVSESYGPIWDFGKDANNLEANDLTKLAAASACRIRVTARTWSAIYNLSEKRIEFSNGVIVKDVLDSCIREFKERYQSIPFRMDTRDAREIESRLRQLGYE